AGRGTFIAGDTNGNGATSSNGNGNGNSNHVATPDTPSTPDRSLREMMRMARKPGIINFGQGAPPDDFFPMLHLRDAISTVLDRDGARALGYEMTEGYAPLRAAVRDYVSALGIRCHVDQVLITGGTQQALDMVVQALLSEGELLVTENPTYLGM